MPTATTRPTARTEPRGLQLRGRLVTAWADGEEIADATVTVVDGSVVALAPSGGGSGDALRSDLPVLGGPTAVIGPGFFDAHVHLAVADTGAERLLSTGVVGVRDLGAPLARAGVLRALPAPLVRVAGPILTAVGGYPSRSWGAGGFALGVGDPASARKAVRSLAEAGVDLVKLALEPAGGPVPDALTARAVVEAAHDAGLAVTCHALGVSSVAAALDAGVDELCHVPVQPLPAPLVARLAARPTPVVSTLLTHTQDPLRRAAVLANAAALVAAGVPLIYGTDLGNSGVRPRVEIAELELLAGSGLGVRGALVAATTGAASAAGMPGAAAGSLTRGGRAALVVLSGDPRTDLGHLHDPLAVVCAGEVRARASAAAGQAR